MAGSTLTVGSEGTGGSIAKPVLLPLLQRTFPHTTICWNDKPGLADLVIRSHFFRSEMPIRENYNKPYISWSGEAYTVVPRPHMNPILEVNTSIAGRPHEVWLPHLIAEIDHVERPVAHKPKRWCCAYAFSHRVLERERLFWTMRIKEPTCYGFGASCRTRDNPFELPIERRVENWSYFNDFGFNVAMENKIAPGYITEKIGHAFKSGSVPIYWGDREAVEFFFNPASYINVLDFPTPDAAGEYAVEVWRDPQKLQKYLDAPITVNNNLADYEAIRTAYRPWQKPIVDILRETFPDLS
jgi:hypothetical protein